MQFFIILSAIILASQAIELPSNFKKCNRKSDNFKVCLLEAAQFGIKQLNRPYKQFKIASLNPLEVTKIEASVATPLANVTANLIDCKFWGLIDAKFTKFDFDFDAKKIQIEGIWPRIKSQCYSKTQGLIFNSKIEAEGSSSADFKNFRFNFELKYEEVKRRGKTYVKPVFSSFDGKPEFLSMNLGLLDDESNERFTKILSDNWEELYDEVKIYYLENAKQTFLQVTSGWFQRLSLEEAFD